MNSERMRRASSSALGRNELKPLVHWTVVSFAKGALGDTLDAEKFLCALVAKKREWL